MLKVFKNDKIYKKVSQARMSHTLPQCLFFFLLILPTVNLASQKELKRDLSHQTIKLNSNTKIQAKLLRYQNKSNPSKLPFVLILGGFETGANAVELVKPRFPVLLASFDYPYQPPKKWHLSDFFSELNKIKKATHETIQGMVRLYQKIKKRKDTAPDYGTMVGASFGAPFVLLSSSKIKDIKGIALLHGFADIRNVLEHRLQQLWVSKYGSWAKPFIWLLSYFLWWYLDIEDPSKIIQTYDSDQHVLLIEAKYDEFIPKEAQTSLKMNLNKSDAIVKKKKYHSGHLMPGKENILKQMLHDVTQWMKKNSLLNLKKKSH